LLQEFCFELVYGFDPGVNQRVDIPGRTKHAPALAHLLISKPIIIILDNLIILKALLDLCPDPIHSHSKPLKIGGQVGQLLDILGLSVYFLFH
jgi:hypothetical protein